MCEFLNVALFLQHCFWHLYNFLKPISFLQHFPFDVLRWVTYVILQVLFRCKAFDFGQGSNDTHARFEFVCLVTVSMAIDHRRTAVSSASGDPFCWADLPVFGVRTWVDDEHRLPFDAFGARGLAFTVYYE